jgi:hypothetical protein
MTASRRSLCIVSRDPVQCSELVLSLQTLLDPNEEVEIVMDRRRAREVFDPEPPSGRVSMDRRANPDVDLAVKTKGFAIVPLAPRATLGPDAPDADERARFENILSFKRRHDAKPARLAAAATAVVVALVLMPPLSGFSNRVFQSTAALSSPASRPDAIEQSPTTTEPAIAPPPAPSEGIASPAPPHRAVTRSPGAWSRHFASSSAIIDAYAARLEEATGRVVSKAQGLIDRVKTGVIGAVPMHVGSEAPVSAAPTAITRRPADSP